jgi:hypothetical protein
MSPGALWAVSARRHLYTEGNERKLMLAFLRYRDTFAKIDGAWLFAERNLYVDGSRPAHRIPSPSGVPSERKLD